MQRFLICVASAATAAAAASGRAMVGTNIGGWQVIEPWITPSLFYRFLGKTKDEGVGMDQYTLCESLGAEQGNLVLREHWDTWITEEQFKQMAAREVEIIRIPIGDWTLKAYGPYVGCTDGAKDKVQWALDMAQKYNIKVLLDVHAVKDSQNGFDNSGIANRTKWINQNTFTHTPVGEWMGTWNGTSYESINYDNINWAKDTIQGLLDTWGDHEALYAIEPVNEPWYLSDMDVLKQFYRDVRNMMREQQPRLKFVFHDAFHFSAKTWNDLFEDDDIENVVMDTHQYMAWGPPRRNIEHFCSSYDSTISEAEKVKYDVWVGEWSLATDVCATWLGGFQNANFVAINTCQRVDCPKSYMPTQGVDFDRTDENPGPFGIQAQALGDFAFIQNGQCTIDSDHYPESDVMTLGQCVLGTFNEKVEGHFMWTVRNELEDRWNYITSYDKGWIKNNSTAVEEEPVLIAQ